MATVVASVFGFAGTAAASENASMPARASQASGAVVADPVVTAAGRDPSTFAATVEAVEPYLVTDRAGNLHLNVPVRVAGNLDAQSLAALQHSVEVFNGLNQDGAATGVSGAEAFGIPSTILKFVKKYWGQIVDIAKRSGKWAWYKAGQCSAGAATALYRSYGSDPAALAADVKMAVAIAGAGCVANL
ncbi:hypothetical protein [Micromonospora sp. AMSO31t]|uniref:hypothetical protein n=1 Tax=Micromonospora sp. AMSO31t TaxID=2650566 RepID=UPI001CED0042|nr:hypothetical protein [Micromonospora sp. AMSO31t]